MKKLKKYSILVLVLVLIFGASYFLGMRKGQVVKEPEVTTTLINNRLEKAGELVSSKYYYTNTGAYKNQNYFYGWKVPFTGKSFIVSFDGEISLGINLSELEVQVDEQKITIRYPGAEIFSHEIKEESIEVYDEKNSIFNPIKIEDYTQFSLEQKEKIEEDAIKKGLLVEADKHITENIKEILFLDKNIEENYNIIFVAK